MTLLRCVLFLTALGKSGAIFNFRMCLIGKGNGFSFNLLWVMNGFVTQMICEEGESGNRKLGRVSSLLRDPWEEKVLLVLNIVYRCDTWSHLPVSLRIKDIRAVRLTKLESLTLLSCLINQPCNLPFLCIYCAVIMHFIYPFSYVSLLLVDKSILIILQNLTQVSTSEETFRLFLFTLLFQNTFRIWCSDVTSLVLLQSLNCLISLSCFFNLIASSLETQISK